MFTLCDQGHSLYCAHADARAFARARQIQRSREGPPQKQVAMQHSPRSDDSTGVAVRRGSPPPPAPSARITAARYVLYGPPRAPHHHNRGHTGHDHHRDHRVARPGDPGNHRRHDDSRPPITRASMAAHRGRAARRPGTPARSSTTPHAVPHVRLPPSGAPRPTCRMTYEARAPQERQRTAGSVVEADDSRSARWPISVHGGTCGTTRARRVTATAASAVGCVTEPRGLRREVADHVAAAPSRSRPWCRPGVGSRRRPTSPCSAARSFAA